MPLNQTADIPSDPPLYYAVQAQLQGGGTVTCEIEVDGTVISSSTATGGYNIAQCEIGQNAFTGNWENDNSVTPFSLGASEPPPRCLAGRSPRTRLLRPRKPTCATADNRPVSWRPQGVGDRPPL